jgi:hypothetical protein
MAQFANYCMGIRDCRSNSGVDMYSPKPECHMFRTTFGTSSIAYCAQ